MPGKGKPFVSGDPRINLAGKPTGIRDQKWHDLKWWYNLVLDNYKDLNAVQRVELGLKGLALLVSKLPSLPATPDASVQRVIDVRGELESAEKNENIKPGSDAVRMGTGETQIQAGTEAERGL